MGGCRCTYKNCTVRSDGKTHMFHYPVFDKARCHQWLVNARRLEFLELKVSQLKNRVLCQHHFKDECFMNFKKEKLKFDAVPTEDGPYCESNEEFDVKLEKISKKLFIVPEDIENECLSYKEKVANFPVKYGDFLVNSELANTLSFNDNINNSLIDEIPFSVSNNISNIKKRQQAIVIPTISNVTSLNSNKSYSAESANVDQNTSENNNQYKSNLAQIAPVTNKRNTRSTQRIEIISEKKISTPVAIPPNLEPVSPSTILRPNKNKEVKAFDNDIFKNKFEIEILDHSGVVANKEIDVNQNSDVVPLDSQHFLPVASQAVITGNSNLTECDSLLLPLSGLSAQDITKLLNNPPEEPDKVDKASIAKNANKEDIKSNSLLNNQRSKIARERMDTIEIKRKLNKQKLRDMIEFCLDEMDEQDKMTHTNNSLVEKMVGNKSQNIPNNMPTSVARSSPDPINERTKKNSEKVKRHLSEHPSLPSVQEYSVASIEARLQRMEDTLLRRIDQNSHRIEDLKNSMNLSATSKTATTQTTETEEYTKKHLYNELSKFLSPETNSLIYEELFLNKYVKDVKKNVQLSSDLLGPKRRKRK